MQFYFVSYEKSCTFVSGEGQKQALKNLKTFNIMLAVICNIVLFAVMLFLLCFVLPGTIKKVARENLKEYDLNR